MPRLSLRAFAPALAIVAVMALSACTTTAPSSGCCCKQMKCCEKMECCKDGNCTCCDKKDCCVSGCCKGEGAKKGCPYPRKQ